MSRFQSLRMILRAPVHKPKRKEFGSRLLMWFQENGRHNLPWRQTRDPWLTLVAPLLLRKTTSEQVENMYRSFITKFPNPRALMLSSADVVEDLIRPLGMEHERAGRLVDLARQVVTLHQGSVPSTIEELKALPLIGDYTAREVLCIAYGQDEPMLDRNMIRIIRRVFSIESTKKRPHTDSDLWAFAKKLIPKGRGREFNYAIMDFAHAICRAKNPMCSNCPMNDICDYVRVRLP